MPSLKRCKHQSRTDLRSVGAAAIVRDSTPWLCGEFVESFSVVSECADNLQAYRSDFEGPIWFCANHNVANHWCLFDPFWLCIPEFWMNHLGLCLNQQAENNVGWFRWVSIVSHVSPGRRMSGALSWLEDNQGAGLFFHCLFVFIINILYYIILY